MVPVYWGMLCKLSRNFVVPANINLRFESGPPQHVILEQQDHYQTDSIRVRYNNRLIIVALVEMMLDITIF